MVGLEQIDAWRAQLKDEPASFARDLANVLLLQLERLQVAELGSERRVAAKHAALIRAQLASRTECSACRDAALRHTEERMRLFGTPSTRERAAGAVASATAGRPRYS